MTNDQNDQLYDRDHIWPSFQNQALGGWQIAFASNTCL